ncbi:MAG: AAA family ATPase [Phycisphaerae bacterium]|nr:AAA family ATPase [Phycisphaerae bacterium]
MNDREELEQLIRLGHTCITISTFEEEYALQCVRDVALQLNRPMWLWSVSGGIQNGLIAGNPTIPSTDKPGDGLTHFASLSDWPICVTLDLAPHLRDERTLRVLRNLLRQFQETHSQLIMIDHQEDLPRVVNEYATRYTISLPDEQELEHLVRETLRREHRESPIEIDITRSGLQTIIRNLRGLTRRQAERVIADTVVDDRRFDENDINTVLARKRQTLHQGGLLEFVETPVDLSAIGGLRRLKRWLKQRQDALSDSARDYGLAQPRGVLMLGVQGAGKSLCAKAISTAWQRPLLRMDVSSLYDRYVGESERRLRDALHQAEQMAPIILWIDEIEKAFASAASRSTDGGLSQRMFGTLLTWMQEHTQPVFLVATANDIEALPPELLRKGRFDEIFFVDLPQHDTRRQIFAIHLKKRERDPAGFDLDALADAAEGFSGAEIEQAVVAALHEAFFAKVELATAHVLKTVEESPPLSVTMAERVEALRTWAKDRCVPAD